MNNFKKSAEPVSLTQYKKTNHNNDWNLFHQKAQSSYEDCLLQCIFDQNDLCGYTEKKLGKTTHIDHFVKRALDPTLTFDWDNMIAAVKDSRYGADYKDGINGVKATDYNASNHTYTHLLNPAKDSIVNRFSFSTDGSIYPTDPNDADAIFTIDKFNLNEKSLMTERRIAMDGVRSYLKNGLSAEDVEQIIADEPFISALKYEISQ